MPVAFAYLGLVVSPVPRTSPVIGAWQRGPRGERARSLRSSGDRAAAGGCGPPAFQGSGLPSFSPRAGVAILPLLQRGGGATVPIFKTQLRSVFPGPPIYFTEFIFGMVIS